MQALTAALPMGAGGTCSFVGSHLDVVPANPETWEVDPFKLTVDGDKLFGRGTTDCLGHVAMIVRSAPTISMLLSNAHWAVALGPPDGHVLHDCGAQAGAGRRGDCLLHRLRGVHCHRRRRGGYACEGRQARASEKRPGVLVRDHASPALCGARDPNTLVRAGRCDSADSQPCIGTAAAIQWTLKATGYLFHSGLPHKGINSLELGSEAVVRAPPAPPPAPAVAATSAERCGGAPGGAPEAFLRGLPRARTGEGLRLCDAVHDEADTDQVRGGGREPAAAVDRVPGEHSRLQTALLAGLRFHTDAPLSSRGTSG